MQPLRTSRTVAELGATCMESPVAVRHEPPARWHILPQAVHVLALRRAASASVRPPASAAAAADSGTRSPLGDAGPRARNARAFPGDWLAGPGEREFQLHAAPLSGRRRLGRLTASITFKWVVHVFRLGVVSDRSSRCAKSPRFDCLVVRSARLSKLHVRGQLRHRTRGFRRQP